MDWLDGSDSLMVRKFREPVTPEVMAEAVVEDVMRLLTTDFREKRRQPEIDPKQAQQPGNISIKAKNRSIATYINNGNINQNNY